MFLLMKITFQKSREIKFRAWDKRNSKMYYSDKKVTVWAGGLEPSVNADAGKIMSDFEIMQFTGLLDKNGKEIYEGDIRRNINHYEGNGKTKPYYNYHKIVWDEKLGAWAAIHLENTDESLTTNGNCFLYVYLKSSDSEHVGNIYETPELLKP